MSNWSVYSPCVWQQFSSRPSLRLNICRSRGVACKTQPSLLSNNSQLKKKKILKNINRSNNNNTEQGVGYNLLRFGFRSLRGFFSLSLFLVAMENCYALPFQLNAASTLKKKQQQFILLARPRGCQNSNCLRVKKSASTSGPPKPPRTVWVQLSYPLSEKLPKVTGSESRAYYKIWLRCYQSLMLLNTTKFLCPKTNGIWFFVWENYQVREEIHHTVNVVQWSKNEHPLP